MAWVGSTVQSKNESIFRITRATSLLVFICYFVLPSLNKDFTYYRFLAII